MSAQILPISGGVNIPDCLRQMADHIEAMPKQPTSVTMIVNSSLYCFGPIGNDRLSECTAFDLAFGMQYLMALPVQAALKAEGKL